MAKHKTVSCDESVETVCRRSAVYAGALLITVNEHSMNCIDKPRLAVNVAWSSWLRRGHVNVSHTQVSQQC